MTPSELDSLWTKLGQKQASYALEKTVDELINDAINKWLDWYDGNYGSWPTSEMPRWEALYNQTLKTLDAAIAQAGNTAYVNVSSSGPVREIAPISIWGRITKKQKKYIAGGVLAILGVIAASKVRT